MHTFQLFNWLAPREGLGCLLTFLAFCSTQRSNVSTLVFSSTYSSMMCLLFAKTFLKSSYVIPSKSLKLTIHPINNAITTWTYFHFCWNSPSSSWLGSHFKTFCCYSKTDWNITELECSIRWSIILVQSHGWCLIWCFHDFIIESRYIIYLSYFNVSESLWINNFLLAELITI